MADYLAYLFVPDDQGRLCGAVTFWDLPQPPEDEEEMKRRGREILDYYFGPPAISTQPIPQ